MIRIGVKGFLLWIIILVPISLVFAQETWTRQIDLPGDQYVRGGAWYPNGNILVYGDIRDPGGYDDPWVLCLTADGNILWQRRYGDDRYEYVTSADITPSGDLYLAGSSEGESFVINAGQEGELYWKRSYDMAVARLLVTNDDHVIMVGSFRSGDPAYDLQIRLCKVDGAGDQIWVQTYGYNGDQAGEDLVPLEDGGYLIGGETQWYSYQHREYWTLRTDASGALEWDQTWGVEDVQLNLTRVIRSQDGGFLFLGGGNGIRLLKLDSTGVEIWNTCHTTDECYWNVNDLLETPQGKIMVTGKQDYWGSPHGDFLLMQFDESGEMEWLESYSAAGIEWAKSILPTPDGGYLLIGSTYDFRDGESDCWLVKTDSTGYVTPTGIQPSPTYVPRSLDLDLYPNPVNHECTFTLTLEQAANVRIVIYDQLGSEIWSTYHTATHAGIDRVRWELPASIASGIYLIRASTGEASSTSRILVLR